MTPKEEWDRINNPKCAGDYGLSVSEDELRTFKEGRAILLEIRLLERSRKRSANIAKRFAKSVAYEKYNIMSEILKSLAK